MYTDILNMTRQEYKIYHESYMENNQGSDPIHTFLCIFFTAQCSLICAISSKSGKSSILREYVILVLPSILVHTVLSDYIYFFNFIIFIILFRQIKGTLEHVNTNSNLKEKNQDCKILTISYVRSLTYLITTFCILAVDFKSFPRYLAKTEDYGYSFMDAGAGLFVLMSGLVHKDSPTVDHFIKSNLKLIVILVNLGSIRFLTVRSFHYHEHITEYGLHWNFFFTLAVCKSMSSLILFLFRKLIPNPMFLSFAILLLHEFLLYIGLQEWVFNKLQRTNLINANKEGITSNLGYISLYLFAVYLKNVIVAKSVSRFESQIKLIKLSMLMWILASVINEYRPTSRTLANAGYCIYLEAVILTIITVFYYFETKHLEKRFQLMLPVILSSIDQNGLIFFLIANLLTGAINLFMWTLHTPPLNTFVILNFYMVATILLTMLLTKIGIRV